MMNNTERIIQLITETARPEAIAAALKSGKNPGVTALEVQERLGIVRNNASTLLNQLHKDGRLVKVNGRPVSFFAASLLGQMKEKFALAPKSQYTLAELKKAMVEGEAGADPFRHLLGARGSLANQIGQAKAAIMYPPKGLHTLILGESGVGKTTFAAAMHAYGMLSQKKTPQQYPLVSFNCADYFNNPELLLSQLFGHVKHAFTGAEQEKAGLVEKADGGILFLDEIHRLPPAGQEMLFYLMDKGEYSRLGESSARQKSKVLIIAATTEEPSGALLAAFTRRIPVAITLPPLAEKPVGERVKIVDYFFHCEAVNLARPVILAPEVLKALSVHSFRAGNIGRLRSEIKLLCAKAFLQHLQSGQAIWIDFSMLSKEIREALLDYARLDGETKSYLDMFSEDIVISPNEKREYGPVEIKSDVYERIMQKLDALKTRGLSTQSINALLQSEIDGYFAEVMRHFHAARVDIRTLYKLIPKEIVDATAEMIEFAQRHLGAKFNTKFIFGLSFHMQALLKRIETGKVIANPHLSKIKREHPKEFQVAKELVKKIGETFGIRAPEDEEGFLALLLAHNRRRADDMDKIGVVIVCHGNATASSMADAVNTLLNVDWVKAIDMPLSADIDETYNKLRAMVSALKFGRGLLLLTDMGSLPTFGPRLAADIGVKTRVVERVSTPLALEALRCALYKSDDLDAVYESLVGKPETASEISRRRPAILSVCVTGQGASRMADKILTELLKQRRYEHIQTLVVSYLDVKKEIAAYRARYRLLAVVGNIDPELGLPYFPIAKLLSPDFQADFFRLLDGDFHPAAAASSERSVYDKAKELLEQYVKYINPKPAVARIKAVIDAIGYAPEEEERVLDLVVHMGCMLDRCMHHDAILFEDTRRFKTKYQHDFERVRGAVDALEKEYDIKINDDEICYIVKIIKLRK